MSIGTLREKPLHAAIKRWYAEDDDLVEAPVESFVIDLVRDGLLIEIQTRGFSSMKRKLAALLDDHEIRIVHPVAGLKWIVKIDGDGQVLSRRRSPKRASHLDLFAELVSFPELVTHPNLALEVLVVEEDEIRTYDGTKGWRRKGWVVEERRLVEVLDRFPVPHAGVLAGWLPEGLVNPFTTADLADAIGRPRRLAQQMAYCLHRAGQIDIAGKAGNAILYETTSLE